MDDKDYDLERESIFDRLITEMKTRKPEDIILVARPKKIKKDGEYIFVKADVESSRVEEDLLIELSVLETKIRLIATGKYHVQNNV